MNVEQLYRLLPAIYRLRDAEREEPLKALLTVIAEQITVLEEDLAQRYDDQFIETCADWVVPYLGDLVGFRTRYGTGEQTPSPRAEVANTIGYRRRKGTATILEQLARDVTGWDARVVEFFRLLATTQHVNHVRPENRCCPDLRDWETLEYAGSAFDALPRTVDVRRIQVNRGRYNLPNIGVFLWRLQDYPVQRSTAFRVADGCYTFHPFGLDTPLFTRPQPEVDVSHQAEPIHVADPLRRRPLYEELEAQRQSLVDGEPEGPVIESSVYFGRDPVLRVFRDNVEVKSSEILICDLSDPVAPLDSFWRRPPGHKPYQPSTPEQPVQKLPIAVAVDPVLGRLAFPGDVTAKRVEVSYAYGFSGDMGSGPYRRPEPAVAPATHVISGGGAALAEALSAIGPADVVIEIGDSATLDGDLEIKPGNGQKLTIRARDGIRAVLRGAFTVAAANDAEVTLDGLLISGGILVSGTAELSLAVRHCTLAPWLAHNQGAPQPPAEPSISWVAEDAAGRLMLAHSISGRLTVGPGVDVAIADSIVDALQDDAPAGAGSEDGRAATGPVHVVRSTIVGVLSAARMKLAENSVFTGRVTVEQKQQGCVRYCYLPLDSRAPRRFHCYPARADAAGRIQPRFVSLRWGDPGYGQLSRSCPAELRRGADDESELGAFHSQYTPRRETDLQTCLNEHLRIGLEAGICYET